MCEEFMASPDDHPLYIATHRLVRALDTLENNLQQVTVGRDRDVMQHQHIQHYERENAALRAQQAELSDSLANMQQQYDELQTVATTIYGKLDDAIARLSKILES
jgi:DNA repair exonuclease SbcCD ATPase subunit